MERMARESLLLHVCCAPCSIAVINELRKTYNLTVYFYNPNIFPEAEYLKRKAEVTRLCDEWRVAQVDADYDPGEWEATCGDGGADKEGGSRCSRCLKLRLAATANYAAAHGFDLWSSSLPSGRQKVTYVVTLIGEREADRVGVPYLATDWKKGGRQEKSRQMVDERGIYRQDYCGCRFSLAARDARSKK